MALVAAIWLSNFPEALGSTVGLLKSGMSKGKVFVMWLAIVGVSTLSAAIGYLIVSESSTLTGALVSAFAAGALLTISPTRWPRRSYKKGGKLVGLVVTLGFILPSGSLASTCSGSPHPQVGLLAASLCMMGS